MLNALLTRKLINFLLCQIGYMCLVKIFLKAFILLSIHKRAFDVTLDKVRKKVHSREDNLIICLDCEALEFISLPMEVSFAILASLSKELISVLELLNSSREVVESSCSPREVVEGSCSPWEVVSSVSLP